MTYVTQIKKKYYIKGDKTKDISSKLLYTHDLEENDNITIQQICLKDNLMDVQFGFKQDTPS